MNKSNRLTIVGLAMIAAVAAVELVAGRIAVGQSRALPIATFPRVIGGWVAGPDRPVDPDLQQRLADSRMVERVYTNHRLGASVDLLLLTSSNLDDFHDPTICIMSQGWSVQSARTVNVANQPATCIIASNEDHTIKTLYWLLGDYAPARAKTPAEKRLYAIRHFIVRRDEGTCLFVRMIANDNPLGDRAFADFIDATRDSIRSLAPNTTCQANQQQ